MIDPSRSQRYVNSGGGCPFHMPRRHVSDWPTAGVPDTCGASMSRGPIPGTWTPLLVTDRVPWPLLAVTLQDSTRPRLALVTVNVFAVAEGISVPANCHW